MQKFVSRVNGRPFYVAEECEASFEGVPCFTTKEITIMRSNKYSADELNKIFDTKLELGATVEPLPDPYEDLGYARPKSREELAKDYAARIRDMLRECGARTDEEKKNLQNCN